MSARVVGAFRAKGHLLRILGVAFGLAVGIGSTIGSGIFRTPGQVAAQLGSVWLIIAVWTLGGAYALLCSSSVAELGTMLPQAGGWYVYSRRAFGNYGGFVVGCCDWMMQSVAIAYLAVALGEFAAGMEPRLNGSVKLVAVTSLGLLTFLNWLGLRSGSRTQELTSLAKALGLVAFVVACFTFSVKSAAPAPVVLMSFKGPEGGSVLLGLVVALQAVIVTYDGWYAPIYFAEEDQNPARNLPRSMFGVVFSCVAIFLLVNAALFRILPMAQLAGSKLPAADAARVVFGSDGKNLILLISMIAVISTINASLLIAPRILFGMSRDALFPRWAKSVNEGGTPTVGLILSAFASIALVLSGSFETLIAIASVLFVAVYMSGFAALLVLRKFQPDLPRPYKAWCYPWSTLAVLLASGAFLAGSVIGDLKHSLFTLILIVLSYPLYVLAVRRKLPRETTDTNILPEAEPQQAE
jgi:basic amino acid/polyamine antiporter, APA family